MNNHQKNIQKTKTPLKSQAGFVHKKRLGQNFLTDPKIVQRIIAAAHISSYDIILEVGPGLGALTLPLSTYARHVVAIEKDNHAAILLREKFQQDSGGANVEIVIGDILQFLITPHKVFIKPYKVVANIPYYLTSPFIRMLLELKQKPELIVLTIQKEVAQRICARDGKESILSLSVKLYASVKILFYISKNSFFPVPKVDSAVIVITPKKSKPPVLPKKFFTIVKAGFTSPRKKLITNLAIGLKKDKLELEQIFNLLGLDKLIRAQKLTLEQWVMLSSQIYF